MSRWRSMAVAMMLVLAACSETSEGSGAQDSQIADTVGSSVDTSAERVEESTSTTAPRGFTSEQEAEFQTALEDFYGLQSIDNARRVVELMTLSGEQRFAPWLVDLVQMGLSNLLGVEIIQTLAALTGIEPVGETFTDFGRMGSYVDDQAIDPGEGYREWKLTLYDRIDSAFVPLLDSVTDADRFNRIRFGGVKPGGIPELNDPERISASEAQEWITDDEVVLGVDLDGEVVAYPFRIVGHHELVNDTVAGIPVSVVYCTLCRTGLLFDRRAQGQVLDFQTSGMLINSNKIMVDRQTNTLWHHAAGLGIGGALEGVTLDLFPMETTTWAEWFAEHPDTEVLDIPEPIFFDDPERPPIAYPYEAGGPYGQYYENPKTWFPIRQVSDALEIKDEVLGIQHGGGVLAISVEDVASGPNRYLQVGTSAVVVVPNSRGARVYGADDEALALLSGLENGAEVVVAAADGDSVTLIDGAKLDRIAIEQGFWFSWFDRHPTTELWPEE